MGVLEGRRCPETRQARTILGVREPEHEKLLAGLQFDGQDIEQIRAICKTLWRWRNEWSVRKAAERSRENRGLFAADRGRI